MEGIPYVVKAIEKGLTPLGKSDFIKAFKELGIQSNDNIIAHASLSAFSYILGDERAIFEALMEVIGVAGTLVVPTQTVDITDPIRYEYPPVPKEWWQKIRDEIPAFDKDKSPSRAIGDFAEYVRTYKDSKRSSHPLYSFAAVGEKADFILENHQLDNGLGQNSPLMKLYELDAKILLLGVDFDSNTSLHLAEYYLNRPDLEESSKIIADGQEKWISFKNIDLDIYDDFTDIEKKFYSEKPESYTSTKLNEGSIYLINMRDCVDFAKKYYLEKECNEKIL
ncbi:aminoglycoside N(3)-acetyltransferase [Floricoccus penangensis]|uniref:aminoglycoside N(3)-acetyltransferase n=1 Tax=Floricoccus penangensis TaxID=1859475 RepID=UPI00203A3AC4|nr:AAC(3) family N-acetyltransferase [Floricoccus penangensis]URZ86646.1 AAC(3) family N-acetyltransferase [Floricoccus penangensis]